MDAQGTSIWRLCPRLSQDPVNPLFYQLHASSTLGSTNSCLRPWPPLPLPLSPVENQLGFKVSGLV